MGNDSEKDDKSKHFFELFYQTTLTVGGDHFILQRLITLRLGGFMEFK